MIIELILNLIKTVLFAVFSWINLPNLPDTLLNGLDSFLDLIFENAGVIGFFVRPLTLQVAIPVVIIVVNFDKLYSLTMWILKKIPMLNMK